MERQENLNGNINMKKLKNNNQTLYEYLFHYNYLTNIWSAFTRENYKKYWNGELEEKEILQSRNAMVLVKIINKMKEEVDD